MAYHVGESMMIVGDKKRRLNHSDGVVQEESEFETLQLEDGCGALERSSIIRDANIILVNVRDRISDLPQELIHCILEKLPAYDAAKTSILSKAWRYIWRMNPHLVLDQLFFSQLTSNKEEELHQSVFSRAVDMILLVHVGPILNFALSIPPKLNQCHVRQWIEHLSNKGIRNLALTTAKINAYEIPNCLFECAELTHLMLNTWILNPTNNFRSFTRLVNVTLCNISIMADISFGTQLKIMILVQCTGIEHLGCQFTNGNSLTSLFIFKSKQIDWGWFERTKQLKNFGLQLTDDAHPVNPIKLLHTLPSIHGLFIGGSTLEVLGPHLSRMMGLGTKVENLRRLNLWRLGSYNLRQISHSLCLIRCSPNLQCLTIKLEVEVKSLNPIDITSTLNSEWKDMSLDRLHRVQIQRVVGSSHALHFMKFLLASSPSLRVMSLSCSKAIDANEKLKIKQELQHFPRRSVAARIIWLPDL